MKKWIFSSKGFLTIVAVVIVAIMPSLALSIPFTSTESQTIKSTETAAIPSTKAFKGFKALNKSRTTPIADFDYAVNGNIDSASIEGKWGLKTKWFGLWRLSQLDLISMTNC